MSGKKRKAKSKKRISKTRTGNNSPAITQRDNSAVLINQSVNLDTETAKHQFDKTHESLIKITYELGATNRELGATKSDLEQTRNALELSEQEKAKLKAELEAELKSRHANEALKRFVSGDYGKAKELFSLQVAASAQEKAEAFFYLGKIALLEINYKQALEYLDLASKEDPSNGLYLNEEGSVLHHLARYKEAIEYFERAFPLIQKEEEKAALLNNIGEAWRNLGEYKKAIEEYYEKALAIDQKAFGDEHPNVAICLNNIGCAWDSLGEYKKAIMFFEKALAIDKKAFGEEHPNVAIRLNNIGAAWDSLGEYKKAIGYYEKALAIDRKSFGDKHPNVARDLNNIGGIYFQQSDYKKAIECSERALRILIKFFDENHPYVKAATENLAAARAKLAETKK